MLNSYSGITGNTTAKPSAEFCSQLYTTSVAVTDTNPLPEIINLALNMPTSLAAICGNLVVLISIWSTPSLHSPSHALTFSLAMADFSVGLFVQPTFIVYSIAGITRRLDVLCTSGLIVSSLSYGLCGISLLTLTATTLDRLLAIHLHLRYQTVVTTERVACIILAIWIVGATVAALGPALQDFQAVIFASAVVACVCICLIVFSYWRIFTVVRRHRRQIQDSQSPSLVEVKELKKSSVVPFLLCCLFFLCYLPFVVVTVWSSVKDDKSPFAGQVAFEFSSTVILISSCLKPMVYYWRLSAMRTVFRQTLRKCCILQWKCSSAEHALLTRERAAACDGFITLKSTFSQPFQEECISDVVRIGTV